MWPSIGELAYIPSYVPDRTGPAIDVVPPGGRKRKLVEVSEAELLVRASYLCRRAAYLHREALYLLCRIVELANRLDQQQVVAKLEQELKVFGYICAEARAVVEERSALVEALRERDNTGKIADYLTDSASEFVGLVVVTRVIRDAVKEVVVALLRKVADKLEALSEEIRCCDKERGAV